MRARSGEGLVTVLIAAVLVGGLALDSWGPDLAEPIVRDAPAGDLYTAKAVFCPPPLDRPPAGLTLTAMSRSGVDVTVGIEPESEERLDLPGDAILEHKPTAVGPSDLVGYGGALEGSAVTSLTDPVDGVGAGACSRRASPRWYFPEGNSTVTHDERLLVYNPFPDEAVVRVSLFTPGGERAKAGLADLPVPSESAVIVPLKDFILEQKVLGAAITTVRGRVVAWRLSIAEPEEKASGVQFTLGATSTSDEWYFPEGAIGEGYHERLSVLNPGDQEAVVNVLLVTAEGSAPASSLAEVAVPARSTIQMVLDPSQLAGRRVQLGGFGAVVTSANGVPIVAERTVFYATEDLDGVASEVGASTLSSSWLLGPATSRPDTDTVVLLNPTGKDPVEVSLTLLRENGDPLRPKPLRGLVVNPASRLRIPLMEYTRGEPVAVVVEGSGALVAERFSYSGAAGDVGSLMGIPLD